MRNSKSQPRQSHITRTLVHWFGLLLFALICLLWTPLALLLLALLPETPSRTRFGRRVIRTGFTAYLWLLKSLGILDITINGNKEINSRPPALIAPNHPSIIDAVILLSLVPDCACILKSKLLNHPLFGAGARLAGYISNSSTHEMIRSAVRELREGRSVLMFPEGTRTHTPPLLPLKLSPFIVAKKAHAPLRSVVIRCPAGFLAKETLLSAPHVLPVNISVAFSTEFFITDGDVRSTADRLEQHLRNALVQ